MKCLSKEDLYLYLGGSEFQDESDRKQMRAHLGDCHKCRESLQAYRNEMNAMLQENERECTIIQANLQEYIDGAIQTLDGIDFARHLEDCTYCNFLYYQLKKEYTLEQVNAFEIPVPKRLTQKIKQLTKQPLDLFDRIVAFITPKQREPAFLGIDKTGMAKIDITMEKFEVDIGEPGREVKIFSMNDVELGSQVSNQDGIAVFEGFEPDTYKIMVAGFEVKGIERI